LRRNLSDRSWQFACREIGVRAQRFELNLPVWYRTADETQWHSGVTEMVSASGAVVRAAARLLPARPVHIVIALPSVAGCLIGAGRIVRTVETNGQTVATFAIAVGHFHIRSKAVLKRIA
jgi:hypothetical protein